MKPVHRRDWLFEQLPVRQRQLFEAIEAKQRCQIRVDLRVDHPSPTDPNPDAPACSVGPDGGEIHFRSWDRAEIEGVTHELLHLERYILQSVPQMVPKSDEASQWKVTSAIENCLEHLVIIPKEQEYGYDPIPYWKATYRRNWENFPVDGYSDFAIRKNALLWFASLGIIADVELDDLALKVLDDLELRADAEDFRRKVNVLKGDKAKQISYLCDALGIPKATAAMIRYFPQNWRKSYPIKR